MAAPELVKAEYTPRPGDVEPPKDAALFQVKARCVLDDDGLRSHIRQSMEREGIAHFHPSPQHHREAVLVGSGPSVADQIETIRALKDRGAYVLAIKAAHDFLLERDIVPHVALAVDPQAKIKECFTRNREDIVYFLASQCHPELFDFLAHRKVVLWHLLTGKEQEKELTKGEPLIGGGSTSGMRAMALAHAMGFRRMHIFGYDSCLRDDNLLKITGVVWDEPSVFKLWVQGRDFRCNPAMAAQATEFEKMVNAFRGQCQFKVYGDGLIPWIAKCRIDRKETDDVLPIDQEWKPIPVHPDWWKVAQC